MALGNGYWRRSEIYASCTGPKSEAAIKTGNYEESRMSKIPGRLGLGRRDGMICKQVRLGGRNDHPPSRTKPCQDGSVAVGCFLSLAFQFPHSSILGILENTRVRDAEAHMLPPRRSLESRHATAYLEIKIHDRPPRQDPTRTTKK